MSPDEVWPWPWVYARAKLLACAGGMLTWTRGRCRDVDGAGGEIRIRQQVQRIKGELRFHPVKTAAGGRDLPLPPIAQGMLDLTRQAQPADRQEIGRAWQDNGLIFTTKTGRPEGPRKLVRSFHRICDTYNSAQYQLNLSGPARPTSGNFVIADTRDAQIILCHSRLAVTLETYTHEGRQAQRQAPSRHHVATGQIFGSYITSADANDLLRPHHRLVGGPVSVIPITQRHGSGASLNLTHGSPWWL